MKSFLTVLSLAALVTAIGFTSPPVSAQANACDACNACEARCRTLPKGQYECYQTCPCRGCAGSAR